MRTTVRQLAAFAIVGALGFVVDAAVLKTLLSLTDAGLYVGRVVSFLSAATFTWVLNRSFTFRALRRRRSLFLEWLSFLGANSLGGAVNFGVYSLLVARFKLFTSTPVLGVAAGSLAGLAVNFSLTKLYVYRKDAAGPLS